MVRIGGLFMRRGNRRKNPVGWIIVTVGIIVLLLIATVSDILLLRGYSTGAQIMVKGLIVLAVIVVMHLRTTRGRS